MEGRNQRYWKPFNRVFETLSGWPDGQVEVAETEEDARAVVRDIPIMKTDGRGCRTRQIELGCLTIKIIKRGNRSVSGRDTQGHGLSQKNRNTAPKSVNQATSMVGPAR